MARNKSKADGMRPNGSAQRTSAVQSASATEASSFLFKTARAQVAESSPSTTPRNPFLLPSVPKPINASKSSTTTTTTTSEKNTHKKPLSKEEYLAEAQRRHNVSRARRDAELRELYRSCPSIKRAIKRYSQRRSQWAKSMRKLQKAGAFLENMGALGDAPQLQKTSPNGSAIVTIEPPSANSPALPQTNFTVDDHPDNNSSKAPSVTSSSDETVKSDTRTVDSLSTNITTPDLSDCDSLVKSATKPTKQKTSSSPAAVTPTQTKTDIVTEQPTPKAEKFKITINVETEVPSKESKSSPQNAKKDAAPITTSGALTPKNSVDEKAEKKQKSSSDKADGQELPKEKGEKKEKKTKADDAAQPTPEKKSKKHKRDEDDKDKDEGATEEPKAKKSKICNSEPPAMTPAFGIDKSYKPYPNVPPEIRKELFIVKAEEMLFDPLGYDDLVYDDTRPKSKRPKWRKTGRNTGHNDMMMSGGIGPADGSSSSGSHKSKKNRSGGDDSLSKQVLKKGHNKRVAEEVSSLKESGSSSTSTFGEKKEKNEFKKNKHGHRDHRDQHERDGQKNWKHKPNQSGSLAAKFRRHK